MVPMDYLMYAIEKVEPTGDRFFMSDGCSHWVEFLSNARLFLSQRSVKEEARKAHEEDKANDINIVEVHVEMLNRIPFLRGGKVK